jgi:hypothetical protein
LRFPIIEQEVKALVMGLPAGTGPARGGLDPGRIARRRVETCTPSPALSTDQRDPPQRPP